MNKAVADRYHPPPHAAKIFKEADSILYESVLFRSFVDEWKELIIENSGGYAEGYEGLYLINWHKMISSVDFRPHDGFPELDKNLVKTDKSVILSLIELSNLEISFLSERLKAIRKIPERVVEPKIIREVFLIKELELGWGKVLPGPRLWKIKYYPIYTLEINGISYWAEGGYKFSSEEWKSIQPIMNMKIAVLSDYGDTTIHFQYHKR